MWPQTAVSSAVFGVTTCRHNRFPITTFDNDIPRNSRKCSSHGRDIHQNAGIEAILVAAGGDGAPNCSNDAMAGGTAGK
jgi:hypothetical protein